MLRRSDLVVRRSRFALVLFAVMSVPMVTRADVRLPSIFGDNMVLQQQTKAPIWGWAKAGERVRVKAAWLADELVATTNDDGTWSLRLPTPKAGGPFALTIAGKNTITLENVMIGEVWICSGQSNMEWCVDYGIMDGEKEAASANYPNIRLFAVPHRFSITPQRDCQASWTACTPETMRSFSAIGYFYGRVLHRMLDVPIGLIGVNWGGTVAETWTSEKALRKLGGFDDALAVVEAERRNPGLAASKHAQEIRGWWRAAEQRSARSTGTKCSAANYDDSSWKTAHIPGPWEQSDIGVFDGIVWYRTEFDVPSQWAGRELTLELGAIDDMDTTWFNGVRAGGFEQPGYWSTPRKYAVPAEAVHAGRNVLAVRVLDTGGVGGFSGKDELLRLYPTEEGPESALPLAGDWRYRRGPALSELPPWPQTHRIHQNTPTTLSSGMLEPLIPFGIRGAIWYQGEANRTRALQYRTLFPAMIADWRERWGQGDFPFYYVQIAPFLYGGDTGQAAELREAQTMALAVPNTGMAVTMDIGDPTNIHPKNKQEVGRRLALWALSGTYGRDGIEVSGPLYKSMKVEHGAIRLFFDHAELGLVARDSGPLTHFTIAGADHKFYGATARIDGETVIVSSAQVPVPVAVRYAWGAADQPNLSNRAGLPAPSFRTDDWRRE